MAIKSAPPQPDLPNIRKPLRARPLWRLFGWGSAATIALAAVALTSQTEAGGKRLQLALAYVSEPGRAVAQIPPRGESEAEGETKRLAAQVRDLAAARAANTPPPAPSAPATTPAVVAAAPPPTRALPALTPLAMPAVREVAASWPTKTPEAAAPAPEPAPPPPVQVATAPPLEPVALPPPKPDYGIDLGGAGTIEALRIHWAALKANYGPLLVGLHPPATIVALQLIVLKEIVSRNEKWNTLPYTKATASH